jgi:hypothetical protein
MNIRSKQTLRSFITGARPSRLLEKALLFLLDCIPRAAVSTAEQVVDAADEDINLTSYHTKMNDTAEALSPALAAGAFLGQRKLISFVVDTGNSAVLTVTPGLTSGDNTVTFDDAGDQWLGEWNGQTWDTLMTMGAVDAGPVISTV